MSEAIRLGIAGMGGYAGQMLDWLLRSEPSVSAVHIGAVCDPQPAQFGAIADELNRRSIPVRSTYDQLLSEQLDAVYLPLPIHLHREYTERALATGKAVLCEKPAAGSVEDVDAMIAARDRARLPLAIGFQHVYQPAIVRLRARLAAGEFGAVQRASVLGCWPRDLAYFRRNDWAGRIRYQGRMVLDSPANNAMAHYIHLCLFLLNSGPRHVEAELYRANPIENYDTCSMRITLASGASVLVGLTHAAAQRVDVEVILHTDAGRICFEAPDRVRIETERNSETIHLDQPLQLAMFRAFSEYVREPRQDAVGTLASSRFHSAVIAAVSEACTIVDVPASAIVENPNMRVISGIEQMLSQSVHAGQMLFESRLASWAKPPHFCQIS